MHLVAPVSARLEAEVTELAGRVAGAADLSRLQAQGAFPTATPFAHVLPAGINARGDNDLVTGLHRQAIERLVAVILTVRSQDPTGAWAVERIDGLIDDIVEAVAGWGPEEGADAFDLRRVRLLRAEGGAFVYELTFALPDQLRIAA